MDRVLGTEHADALFLDDRFSPFPQGHAPRLTGIEEFRMGEGNDIVDLTSSLFQLGPVSIDVGRVMTCSGPAPGMIGCSEGRATTSFLAAGVVITWSATPETICCKAGTVTISISLAEHGGSDTLRFGSEISAEQVWFQRMEDDLLVSLIGSTDGITIDDWYGGDAHPVERFEAGPDRTGCCWKLRCSDCWTPWPLSIRRLWANWTYHRNWNNPCCR